MNLSEKMTEWGILKLQLEQLEKQIQEDVLALGQTQNVGNVEATYRKTAGNGSYDYKAVCDNELHLEPQVVEQFQTVSYDWRKIAEASGMTDEIKAKYYTPAKNSAPSVTVKFTK